MSELGSKPPEASAETSTGRGPAREDDGFSVLVSSAHGIGSVKLDAARDIVLGRTSDADLPVADASVSRRHAILRLREMTIEDLGSTNGTRVNGNKLRAGERAPVTEGTVIEIGDATVLLHKARALPDAVDARPRAAPTSKRPRRVVIDGTMARLYGLLDVIAPSPLHVLILGETGVGKELFAEEVHARSQRAHAQLLRLNCAALPESVLEGELFGYERGAFTGATQARAGLFEAASGGTVFLDEVGELPLATQAKLLRVLENGEVLRLGGRQPTSVDLRFVSATNRDLRFLIANGSFRADLFFRLNGMSVTIPPLRNRTVDIAPLAERFLDDLAARVGRSAPRLTDAAVAALERYPWPGNVRELKNVIERALVMCKESSLDVSHLRDAAPELFDVVIAASEDELASFAQTTSPIPLPTLPPRSPESHRLRVHVDAAERARIVEALAQANGNQTRAAALLGVSRRTLVNKLEIHGIGRPRKDAK